MKTIAQAMTCPPGRDFADQPLIGPSIGIADAARALLQHQNYCDALEQCGVRIQTLNSSLSLAQSTAVVTDYLAVIATAPEQTQKDVASALAGVRCLKFITAPGQLDGRDVLRVDNHFFIGISADTNEEGAAQLAFHLHEYGYAATILDFDRSLRLGSAGKWLGGNKILLREELARHYAFLAYDKIIVPYEERGAANAEMVNGTLILPAGYAETRDAVKAAGIAVIEVNVSEFEKINGGLNCLSLMLSDNRRGSEISLPEKATIRAVA